MSSQHTTRSRFTRAALGAAIAASLSATAVQAQDEFVLEEVIITAQKRPQGLQEVPISVATLSGERMDAIFNDGSDILALAARVPGLYAESSNGRASPRFYIRGLGNVDFDLAASQPVSVVMDDVVMENVVLKSFPLFDVRQVEVVRGPQGTLFGRNTTAGVVKFDTNRPTFENEGYVNLTAGTLGTRNLEAAYGGALIEDTLAARVSVLSQQRSDWIDNTYTGEDDAMGGFTENAIRGQLLWTPTDDFSALLSYQDRDLNGTSSIFRANVFTTGKSGLNENFDRDKVAYNEGDNNPQGVDGSGTTLKLDWDFGETAMTMITAYQRANSFSKGDIDGGNPSGPGFIPFQAVTEDQADVWQFTQELRITSDYDGPFNWQAGGFYYDSSLDVTTIDGFFGKTTVTHDNTTWALFGQGTYDVTDDWDVSMGLRYTYDEKSLEVGEQNVDGFALVIGAASIQTYEPVEVDDGRMGWELATNYQLNDHSSVFGRIANGFRAQSIQARDVAFEGMPSVADAETITSFELGYKADLLERRMRLNVGTFYYQVNDIQLSAIGGANNGNSLLNADKGVGYGFEFDLEYAVTENFFATAGVGYAKTELQDKDLTTAPCGSGQCTVLDPIDGSGNAILDGNPFQAAPELTANLTLRYGIPVSSGEFYGFTDWAYQGETNLALYESEEFQTDGQFEGGMRLGYINDNHNYEVALYGRNITDEENVKGFIDFNNNTGFVNQPRTFGVDFRMDF